IPFPAGANARIQTHNAHFVDFVPVYTENVQFNATALSEYIPAVAEALLPTAPENVCTIFGTLLRAPGESGAPQATIRRVSDDQGPDFEKHGIADKERELWVLPRHATDIFGLCKLGDVVQRAKCEIVYCIAYADDLAIPQFRLSVYKQINNAESDRMAEPCTNRVRRRH
ncbi:hypothetical protein IWW52_002547, partial [Coemansia sp. RSA 2704]